MKDLIEELAHALSLAGIGESYASHSTANLAHLAATRPDRHKRAAMRRVVAKHRPIKLFTGASDRRAANSGRPGSGRLTTPRAIVPVSTRIA